MVITNALLLFLLKELNFYLGINLKITDKELQYDKNVSISPLSETHMQNQAIHYETNYCNNTFPFIQLTCY